MPGTPCDFRQPRAIGAQLDQADEQLARGQGYDHNFVLNQADQGLCWAARAYEPISQRVLDVYTTEPGIEFYRGNFLDGQQIGPSGAAYLRSWDYAWSPSTFRTRQTSPFSPPPSSAPGHKYRSTTVDRFSVAETIAAKELA